MERINRPRPKNAILANDPSFKAWGWVVIVEDKIIDCGVIKTDKMSDKLRIRKGDDNVRRISEINSNLTEVIKKYDIKYIVSELPHGSQSASAAYFLGAATACIQSISNCFDIGIEFFSEGDCKKAAYGKTAGEKIEMIKAMDKLYTMPWYNVKWKDEAIADAMGVYNCAKKHSPVIKFLK